MSQRGAEASKRARMGKGYNLRQIAKGNRDGTITGAGAVENTDAQRERDLQKLSRGQFASTMQHFLGEWRERELKAIDSRAKQAADDGQLAAVAEQLWIERLAINKMVRSLQGMEAGAAAARKRLDGQM